MAINQEVTSAFIVPNQLEHQEETMQFLKNHYKKLYKQVQKNQKKKFAWLERTLSEEKLRWLKNQNLKDIHFIKEPSRFYPFDKTAPVVGFTDIDNSGIAGIELQFNKRLSGTPTIIELQKDARSKKFYFKKKVKKKGKKGEPVYLTLNPKLQFLAYQELNETVEKFEAKSGKYLLWQTIQALIQIKKK